jgi:hypothetical protein
MWINIGWCESSDISVHFHFKSTIHIFLGHTSINRCHHFMFINTHRSQGLTLSHCTLRYKIDNPLIKNSKSWKNESWCDVQQSKWRMVTAIVLASTFEYQNGWCREKFPTVGWWSYNAYIEHANWQLNAGKWSFE